MELAQVKAESAPIEPKASIGKMDVLDYESEKPRKMDSLSPDYKNCYPYSTKFLE